MRYLIVGCGRVGSTLAKLLVAEHDVVVVDENPGAFKRLGARFGGGVEVGTGIDYDVLKRAGAEKADGFVAVTDGDNRNVMAALIGGILPVFYLALTVESAGLTEAEGRAARKQACRCVALANAEAQSAAFPVSASRCSLPSSWAMASSTCCRSLRAPDRSPCAYSVSLATAEKTSSSLRVNEQSGIIAKRLGIGVASVYRILAERKLS